MALVININGFTSGLRSGKEIQRISREIGQVTGTITFDASYATGGETVSGTGVLDSNSKYTGLNNFFRATGTTSGILQLDLAMPNGLRAVLSGAAGSEVLKVYGKAPPIVYEEQQTIASNAVTLNYPAAFIIYVAQADANVAVAPYGTTLASGQCKPTAAQAWGTQTGLTFHSGLSGVVYVTYVTQAWKDVWDNLIQNETVTIASNTGTMANVPLAVQTGRIVGTTSTNSGKPVDKDDTAATLEYALTPTTGVVTTAAGDAATAMSMTYIKKPTSGFLYDRCIAEEAMTAATNVCTPAYPMLIPGYGGYLVELAADDEVVVNLAGTNGAGEGKINLLSATTPMTYTACTTGTNMYVYGTPDEIPGLVDLEIRSGISLAALGAIPFRAIGYIRP